MSQRIDLIRSSLPSSEQLILESVEETIVGQGDVLDLAFQKLGIRDARLLPSGIMGGMSS